MNDLIGIKNIILMCTLGIYSLIGQWYEVNWKYWKSVWRNINLY